MMEMIPLAHFANSAEAGLACELLQNNGIRATLGNANFGALDPLPLPGGFSEISLLVASEDFEQARQLYEAYFARDTANEIDGLPENIGDNAEDND